MSNIINANDTYNEGERMMPIPSYGDDELIRHYSSHNFFRQIIEQDIKRDKLKNLTILDLGFGTGYASFLYSKINSVSNIHAIDVTDDGLGWALENFNNEKINYELVDAATCMSREIKYDYIVTRHVLEHIKDGLNVVKENKYSKRLCINVPYDEGKGNPFHLLTGIVENSFPKYENVEFFYEDLQGNTYDKKPNGIYINSIIFIASKSGMASVKSYFTFPVKATTIDTIIDEFSESNTNYSRSAMKIMLERYNNLVVQKEEVEIKLKQQLDACRGEFEKSVIEKKQYITDVDSLVRELDSIKGSKKWKYMKRLARLKKRMNRD